MSNINTFLNDFSIEKGIIIGHKLSVINGLGLLLHNFTNFFFFLNINISSKIFPVEGRRVQRSKRCSKCQNGVGASRTESLNEIYIFCCIPFSN